MKKLFMFILPMLLTSCKTFEIFTVADKQKYYDEEAIIAYEFYNELYENDVINDKPIIVMKK